MHSAPARISRCLAALSALTRAAGCLDLSLGHRAFACPECADDFGMPDALATDAGEHACDCPLPGPSCEGDTRIEAQSARCLTHGGCAYSGVATVCPDGCADSTCLGDRCLGLVLPHTPCSHLRGRQDAPSVRHVIGDRENLDAAWADDEYEELPAPGTP